MIKGKLIIVLLVFSFILSFAISYFLQKIIIRVSKKNGIFDSVSERKLKKEPKPMLGGVGIFLSVLFTNLFLIILSSILYPSQLKFMLNRYEDFALTSFVIILSTFIIFLLGLLDDLFELSYKIKIVVQFIVASGIYFCCLKISYISVPFGSEFSPIGFLSFFITVVWIIGATNSVNLIDGVDGLAGGIISIVSFFMIIIFLISGDVIFALLLAPLFGAVSGFLPFNKFPSKILMGDSGSLMSGFILSIFALKTSNKSTFGFMIIVPFALLGIPILDTILAFSRRLLTGKSPFKADGDHIHHRLIRKGLSEKRTTITLCIVTFFFSVIALASVLISKHLRVFLLGTFFLIIFAIIIYLNFIKIEWLKKFFSDKIK